MPSAEQAFIGKLQGGFQRTLSHTDAGEMEEGSAGCLRAPCCLEEGVVGFVQSVQHLKCKTEVEVGLA